MEPTPASLDLSAVPWTLFLVGEGESTRPKTPPPYPAQPRKRPNPRLTPVTEPHPISHYSFPTVRVGSLAAQPKEAATGLELDLPT